MLDPKTSSAVSVLARFGSFREAAAALGISPASFSRRIGEAENYCGQKLFERKRSGAVVTPAGQEFLRLLEVFEAASGVFEQGVTRLRDTGSDILRIGCGPLTTRTVIAPLLTDLQAQMPELRARVDVRATKEPLEALRGGQIDVAVCDLTHTPDLSDLDILMVRRQPVSFWARPEHPIHVRGALTLAELFREPLLSPHLHRHWRTSIAEVLGGDEAAWQRVQRLPSIESDDYGLLAELACQSDVIVGGMAESFAEHAALGTLVKIETKNEMLWNICGARRKGVSFTALDRFWAALSEGYSAEAGGCLK